jgi:hypothetical protein
MDERKRIKFGIRFAKVCESFNHAVSVAGGATQNVDAILSMDMETLFYTMANNGIRFTNVPRTIGCDGEEETEAKES